MMTAFTVVGVLAAIAGLVMLVTAIRHQGEQRPRYAAMLIGGMKYRPSASEIEMYQGLKGMTR